MQQKYIVIFLIFLFLNTKYLCASELHFAAKNGDIPKIRALLKRGADINQVLKDDAGDAEWYNGTPLHWAAASGQLEVIKLLIANGADVNAKTYGGDSLVVSTPLESAVYYKHKDIVIYLLKSGASVEGAGHEFYSPLGIAASKGSLDILDILLSHGAWINRAGVDGYTALHHAVDKNRKGAAEVLLKKGADANSGWPIDGTTPLHLAAENGNLEIIKLLIKHGACFTLKNNESNTPVLISKIKGHKEVTAFFQKELQKRAKFIPTYKSNVLDSDYYRLCENNWKIIASSTLKSQRNISYDIELIDDMMGETAWVEGVEGYGIGEQITFQPIKNTSGGMRISGVFMVTGYAKSNKIWKSNSRVKTIRVDQNSTKVCYINFEDSIKLQEVKFPTIFVTNKDVIKFIIIDIYPGDTYKDTAISEMSFICD